MTEPLITWRGQVLPEWTDYNGHLRDAFYLLIFSYAVDGFMDVIGLDTEGREASGHSLFTLECHLNFLHEVKQAEAVEVRVRLLGNDHKRVHLYLALHQAGGATELAASEQMLLNVDMAGPKSAPFDRATAQQLASLAQQQVGLPAPQWTGRVIGLPGRP
ncbi:thioesterase family protein [Pseudomonas typographi]|uniref:Thioesterase n=1 Tax=Pseudomonas typographi TaxID=2715964 RepID=A0ABR7YVL8_9PSED|nr:thioesterase family protein [Pseudomonas typographi]MBD1554922.1 thioesterase [Pseudomonas typographi]MBD1585200.1 thioesterase [Pseudomonas typographi]MBD1597247.1 thioesterase [Pseudomonas typographi]